MHFIIRITIVAFFSLLIHQATAQEGKAVQQEIGISGGVGFSFISPVQAPYYNTDNKTNWYATGAFQYNAYFMEGHFHLGAGLGYQQKSHIRMIYWLNARGEEVLYNSPLEAEVTWMLPLEIGYRSQLGGKHNFLIDALIIPTYLAGRYNVHDNNTYWYPQEEHSTPIGLDLGLKVAYQLNLSQKLNLKVAVGSTFDPLLSDSWDINHHTLFLSTGLYYQW